MCATTTYKYNQADFRIESVSNKGIEQPQVLPAETTSRFLILLEAKMLPLANQEGEKPRTSARDAFACKTNHSELTRSFLLKG
jgi:hypothetical protein